MERCCIWAVIGSSDANKYIFWINLGILDSDIEVAVLCKDTGVDQLIFRLASSAATILRHQISMRESALRILVQGLHIRMSRGIVKKVIVFFHILTVIAFWTCQTEEPLLENRVGLIPQTAIAFIVYSPFRRLMITLLSYGLARRRFVTVREN